MAQAAIQPAGFQMEKIIEFSPSTLKAPFFLRCAALFIDYMVLLSLPVAWLIFSKFFGDGTGKLNISGTVWLVVLIAWVINFISAAAASRPDNR